MTPVRFAPEVPDELADAVQWYEARKQGLGDELLADIERELSAQILQQKRREPLIARRRVAEAGA